MVNAVAGVLDSQLSVGATGPSGLGFGQLLVVIPGDDAARPSTSRSASATWSSARRPARGPRVDVTVGLASFPTPRRRDPTELLETAEEAAWAHAPEAAAKSRSRWRAFAKCCKIPDNSRASEPSDLRKLAEKRENSGMSGIRTSAAAEMLGVSPSTLRTWERRLGYPQPQRTEGNHRHYELARDRGAPRRPARDEQHLVRRRGRAPQGPRALLAHPPPGGLRSLRRAQRRSRARGEPRGENARAHARGGAPARPRLGLRALERRGRARVRVPLGDGLAPRSAPPRAARQPPPGHPAARLGPGAQPRERPRPGARALPAPGRPSRSCSSPPTFPTAATARPFARSTPSPSSSAERTRAWT